MATKQAPAWFIFDGGNSLWKSILLTGTRKSDRKEHVMPHALIEDEGGTRFANVRARYANARDFDTDWFGIEGRYFVVGEAAEAEGVVTRRTGSAKYTPDYYGVSLMANLLVLLPEGHDNLRVYASFPPGDVAFVDDLVQSVLGRWAVETSGGKTVRYRIRSVQPYDEPLGGFVCASCDPSGMQYQDSHLSRGSTLVIDIGGKVSSVMRVLQGGRVQYGSAKSVDIGIQDVVYQFTEALKREHPEVKGMRTFNDDVVRLALATGEYAYKGRMLDCRESVRKATVTILNRLNAFYINDFAGGADDRNILVTGGGGGALFGLVKEALGHQRIFRAEQPEAMHLANVRGGERLCRAALALAER